jgi:hypothetical protein
MKFSTVFCPTILCMQVADEMDLLHARILRETGLQAIEVARLLRGIAQRIQTLLNRNSIRNLGKDNGGIAPVIQPDHLDSAGAHLLLTEGSELRLLEDEKEPALHNGEAAGGIGGRSHHLNDLVGCEGFFAAADFNYETEAAWGAIDSLLAEDLHYALADY